MKHILLPTDFSDNARHAIKYALQLYGDEEAHFTLLNTMNIPGTEDNVEADMDDIVARKASEAFTKLLNQIRAEYSTKNFKMETVFRFGTVAGTIAERAQKQAVDLVIMGTRGATGLTKKLIGSNTASVIKKTDCPVLAVPEKCPLVSPDKIIFTLDFDDRLLPNTISPLVTLARKFHSEVFLLHIQKGNEAPGSPKGLDEFFAGITTHYHSIAGDNVISGITNFSEEHDIKMIAMVTHRLNFIDQLLHRSLTRKMAMHTKLPLLALHDKI